jgi:uncharacterized protein DUF6504
MSRFWNPPIAVLVVTAGGLPSAFYWQNQLHHVRRIHNHWRVDQDWLHDPVVRDYFLVTSRTLMALLFHDRVSGGWYLQRLL